MNASFRVLAAWVALAFATQTAAVWAAPLSATVPPLVAASLLGQAATPDPKVEATEWLRRARQAIQEGNLQNAESFLQRAEKLDVRWTPFTLGDTPAKLRAELDKARSSTGPAAGSPMADPFQGRQFDPFAPAAGGPPPSGVTQANFQAPAGGPPAAQRADYAVPSGVQPAAVPGAVRPARYENFPDAGVSAVQGVNPQLKPQSDALLVEARRALSRRDLKRAADLVAQAKRLGVRYELNEDSPQRVEATLSGSQQAQQAKDAGDRSPEAVKQYAGNLVEQAQWLFRWRQFDDAERLVVEAGGLSVPWEAYQRPDALLKEIQQARAQAPAPGSSTLTIAPRVAAPGPNPADAKQQAMDLSRRASEALTAGDLRTADQLLREAEALKTPISAFQPGEPNPAVVRYQLEAARLRVAQQNPPAALPAPGGSALPAPGGEGQSVRFVGAPAADPGQARRLVELGEAALRNQQRDEAARYFNDALRTPNQLDAATVKQIQDRLQELNVPAGPFVGPAGAPGAIIEGTLTEQQLAARQLSAEVNRRLIQAREMQERSPEKALELLLQTQTVVENAKLDPNSREQLKRRVDRAHEDLTQFIAVNKPRLDLERRNQATLEEMERERKYNSELDERVVKLIDEYNRLVDQQRVAEAEQVALRAYELAPGNPVVQQLKRTSRTLRAVYNNNRFRDQAEDGFNRAMLEADEARVPLAGSPYVMPDARDWRALTDRRAAYREQGLPRTKKEMEIEQKLRQPVSLHFDNRPLAEVLDYISKLTKINIFADPRGFAEEGVRSDTPVSVNVDDISLKSALNLFLPPLRLTHVVKDEVLKITSVDLRDGEVHQVIYNVADLVIPIPNFVPSSQMGLGAALRDAYQLANHAGSPSFSGGPTPVFASTNRPAGGGSLNPAVLAQTGADGYVPPQGGQQLGNGPGGLGGGAQPDFDSLIDLITQTVEPNTWQENGGAGAVQPFEGTLSLVISQTQRVHEKIADLLEQLRRLQDMQVTIEVRFITLNDNFFERIGLDFDFDIDDNIDKPYQVFGRPVDTPTSYVAPNSFTPNGGPRRDVQDRDHGPGVSVGLTPQGLFTADMDIPFQQGSFSLATPQFGSFNPGAGATMGFAILSDIEAFFVIEASQGDRRSNVLQAPKVTLYNGQQAFVSDTSQSPFVISVVPVVGDFAAAQMPVIVVLSEGTFLTVQAVVSNDRRFVRLTIVPFFSQIGDVSTFTFEGSSTTDTGTTVEGTDDAPTRRNSNNNITNSGTTVQLPTFSFVTVTTTVSVPDGGTVLLGGIKRLSEGRNEFGVPMLNKLPYINRLFKNVGIGRETQSLMMMVTPRIIIQEEEEALLTGQSPTP